MKVLCMYDALYKNYKEQIEYSEDFAKKFTDEPVVIGEYTDPDPEVDFIKNIYRLEQFGPEPEPIVPAYLDNKDTEVLAVSFSPISSKMMDSFDNLRVIGISRTGTENVNIKAATERGILVVNAAGRNANAVSDYAIGLMLAESRNIARQHALMKNEWIPCKCYCCRSICFRREYEKMECNKGRSGNVVSGIRFHQHSRKTDERKLSHIW